jgi:serine/threonine protein phosphatase PrpC
MSSENVNEWRALGSSIRGASHIQANKPNQDSISWIQGDQEGLPLMLALADGHGSEKYFRSHLGAKFAVQIAIDEMDQLVHQITFPVTNFTLVKQLFNEELPKGIVERWQQMTKQHFNDNPLTPEESQVLDKKEHAEALGTISNNPSIPYGTTLLAVLVTPSFILYLQLGDGDIVMVFESGLVIRPMNTDRRLLANETTSLCTTTLQTIREDVRKQFYALQEQSILPDLIMLSTDGYSNSFSKEGFLQAGPDILTRLCKEGIGALGNSLENRLAETSEKGSGDDISLGLLFRRSALRPG